MTWNEPVLDTCHFEHVNNKNTPILYLIKCGVKWMVALCDFCSQLQ